MSDLITDYSLGCNLRPCNYFLAFMVCVSSFMCLHCTCLFPHELVIDGELIEVKLIGAFIS
jgi:hypothetical protein